MKREDIHVRVSQELDRAYMKHGRDKWGRHEFYAILLEEVEEAWEIIKADGPSYDLQCELIQVVVVVYRYMETGNRYSTDL